VENLSKFNGKFLEIFMENFSNHSPHLVLRSRMITSHTASPPWCLHGIVGQLYFYLTALQNQLYTLYDHVIQKLGLIYTTVILHAKIY
jgi:hypothetical protein